MPRKLRVGGVPEHFNLPWRLALDDDAFAAAGAHVHYSDFPAGTGDLTRALRENDLDIALVLTEGAIADVLQNDRSRLVKIYVESPLVWGIHVAADSDIRRIGDIRDRRIAISRYGSGSHLISIVDAAERGWPTDDMRFVVVNDLSGARQALANGTADVFLWERHMTQPLVDNGEFRRVGERVVPWPAFVASVRKPILDRRAAEIRTVLDVAARYARNLKRRKSAAVQIAKHYNISTIDAQRWLSGVRWGNSYRCPVAMLQRVTAALQDQSVVADTPFEAERIWHRI